MFTIRSFMLLLVLSFQGVFSKRDTEVSCVFRQSCVLPCNVYGSSSTIITWDQLTSGHRNVHSFYDDRDQLGHQDQSFRGRTSLFQDQLYRGNASLLLREVKVQDGGTYRCFTNSSSGDKRFFINLKVEAPVSKVSIHQVENRIICSSERIYPQPELTWSTIPPSNITLENRTTVHQTEDQLYSISSSLMASDNNPDLIYSCTVGTRSNRKTAGFLKFRNSPNPERGLHIVEIIIIALVGLSPVIVTVIQDIISRHCKNKAY